MIGAILQKNGVYVVTNIRIGEERTYEFCCKGAPKHGVIAMGTVGCLQKNREREIFSRGFVFVMDTLEPKALIVYGKLPKELKDKYANKVKIYEYKSECQKGHKQ